MKLGKCGSHPGVGSAKGWTGENWTQSMLWGVWGSGILDIELPATKLGGGYQSSSALFIGYKIDSLSWRVLDTGVEVNKD